MQSTEEVGQNSSWVLIDWPISQLNSLSKNQTHEHPKSPRHTSYRSRKMGKGTETPVGGVGLPRFYLDFEAPFFPFHPERGFFGLRGEVVPLLKRRVRRRTLGSRDLGLALSGQYDASIKIQSY